MAGYTITITPSNDDTGAQTTIQVDTASGSARITELTVRAADGGGLAPQQLPAVNRVVRGIALNQSSHEADRHAIPLLKDHDLRQVTARHRSAATLHPEEQPDC